MFTFSCSTCEAKLVVKDEQLIGKILACPKCGSMVLVQPPDEIPIPPPRGSAKPVVQKRFPDVLTHETASGVIGQVPKESRRSGLFLEIAPPEPDVSETEMKTRKILVGILIGLLMLLLIALGFLMLRKPTRPPQPEQPPVVLRVPAEPPPPIPPAEPEPVIPEDKVHEPLANEELPEMLPQDATAEPEIFQNEPIPKTDDTLSAFERKMPGLLETSVPNIDIAAKLALPVLELNLNQQSLIGFIRMVSDLTSIPITLDIDELKPLSLSVKTPLEGQFQETTVEVILTETLATLGLQWIATDRQILIFPIETAEDTDLTFDISDFAEQTDDLKPDVLAEMIQRLVCPEVNVTVLSDGRVSVEQNDSLRLPGGKSPKRQRDEIRRFLEQLRMIRQLPPQTEWVGEALAPEAFGWDRMIEPMTLNYYRPVPLSRVVNQLESATKLTILVDHQSLHRALCPFAAISTTVQCNDGMVNDALELSLTSVESVALSYRIIDHQTLEITTAESARRPEKMVVEVHRYRLHEEETPEDIRQSLRSAVEPESWFIAEQPETNNGGAIIIDHPSGCLLVRQSQPVQRQIRLYLSTLATQE